jgi:xanthine dioxygenase
MAIELVPLSLPASAEASRFVDFGREVKGVNPGSLSPDEFKEVQEALYRVRYCNHSGHVFPSDF